MRGLNKFKIGVLCFMFTALMAAGYPMRAHALDLGDLGLGDIAGDVLDSLGLGDIAGLVGELVPIEDPANDFRLDVENAFARYTSQILQQLYDSMLSDWLTTGGLSTGYEESPAHWITNVGDYFTTVSNNTYELSRDNYIDKTIQGSPFTDTVKEQLDSSYDDTRGELNPDRIQQLHEGEHAKLQACADGDFETCGWDGFAMISQPQNNARGQYLAGLSQINADIAAQKQVELLSNDANWGWKPQRDCEKRDESGNCILPGDITTPAIAAQETFTQTAVDRPLEKLDDIHLGTDLLGVAQDLLQGKVFDFLTNGIEGYLNGKKKNSGNGNPNDAQHIGNELAGQVNRAYQIEGQYKTSKTSTLSAVQRAETAIKTVDTCRGTVSPILASRITPLKTTLSTAIARSNVSLQSIAALKTRAENATSQSALQAVFSDYTKLASQNLVHTSIDATDKGVQTEMGNLIRQAGQDLQTCRQSQGNTNTGQNPRDGSNR